MNDLAIPDINGPAGPQLGQGNTFMIVIIVAGAVAAAIFFATLFGPPIYRKTKKLFRRTRRWDRRAVR